MPNYVVLGNFSDQGIRAVKETGKHAKAFRDLAKSMGVYDVVLTLQAPNDEAIASLMMKLGSLGNLKSQTLRAFTEAEIDSLVSKI